MSVAGQKEKEEDREKKKKGNREIQCAPMVYNQLSRGMKALGLQKESYSTNTPHHSKHSKIPCNKHSLSTYFCQALC